ncbi:MAG: type B 50S ribosomal protein L31 [Longimicrobiales bacterium]
MKKDIHPTYRPVVFQDVSTGYSFLTRSTVETDRTVKWEDGNEYPLLTLEVSSSSHPFYTGTQRLLDSAGRVDRFKRRYARSDGGAPEAKAGADAAAVDDAEASDDGAAE